MTVLEAPRSPEELASTLLAAASADQSISLAGRSTKRLMAGPVEAAAVTIATTGLSRVLHYEPKDLTISVEAGLPYAELSRILAANRQMVPLDPPFAASATVGGIVSANSSGPRRRLYGTARDLVIGMKFATLEGKLVQTGGMVVKNVAGLDMGKLMIGSFGTLAAIAVLNFKLLPMPEVERLFLLSFDSLHEAMEARRKILTSVLQPSALDLLNPAAASRIGLAGYVLAVQAGGNRAVVERYRRELAELGDLSIDDHDVAERIREFTPAFLSAHADGAVVRVSSTLSEIPQVVDRFPVPVIARAGNGVCYAYFDNALAASEAVRGPSKAIMEFTPEARKSELDLWPSPRQDFEMMKRIKQMLDPKRLLNRGRLYRHL